MYYNIENNKYILWVDGVSSVDIYGAGFFLPLSLKGIFLEKLRLSYDGMPSKNSSIDWNTRKQFKF